MAIHPPITFSAYALLVVPFALGVTHFVARLRGHESPFVEWVDSTTRWLRLSWILLTAAITLGGIWAYRVLGWGGFWSWDPVETAVLIPWLGLTAVVHTLNRYRQTGDYRILAPAATALLFPLTVYATTVVRSGVFRSVHSFASGGIGGGVLVLLGSTSALAAVPAAGYWFLDTTETDASESAAASLLDRATLFHAAVLGFIALAFVSIWGLSFPVLRSVSSGVEVSVDARYYNLWSFPLVVFLLFAGGTYAQSAVTSKRTTLATLGAVVAVTAVVAITVAPTEWQLATPEPYSPLYYRLIGGLSAFTIVPPAAYFALSWGARYVHRVRRLRARRVRLKETGIALVHVGAAMLIVAVTLVYVLSTTASVGVAGATTLNETQSAEMYTVGNTSYEVQLTDYRTENTPSVAEAALSPAEVLDVNRSAAGVLVRGEITAIERYENATIAQLDGSSVWLAADEDSDVFAAGTGAEVVARGSLYEPRSPNIDRLVYTNDRNIGPVSDPPRNIYTPRVVDHVFHVKLYKDGSLLTEGDVVEETYRDSEMRTNDALIDRGVLGDTYVVGTMTNNGVSVQVSRYPLANQIWLGVALMVLGMALVFVFDPASGLRGRD
jgi:cytochrome c-type biogenesis protein CcmF